MSERFYLPADLQAPELTLTGSEAHHLAHVLRLGPGRTVILFDGRGAEVDAKIESTSKREVRLRPEPLRHPPPPTRFPITLAVAPPKGDRFRWLVEKATELGVSRLIPLITTRTVVDPRDGKLEKLRQTIIAASKQSGRCQLMELTDPVPLSRLFEIPEVVPTSVRRLNKLKHSGQGGYAGAEKSADSDDAVLKSAHDETPPLCILLHLNHPPLVHRLSSVTDVPFSSLTLLIGPEGGFTDSEINDARQAGAHCASLGSTILRTETAAITAAAVAAQLTCDR